MVFGSKVFTSKHQAGCTKSLYVSVAKAATVTKQTSLERERIVGRYVWDLGPCLS